MFRKIVAIFLLWLVITLYESCCEKLPYYIFDRIELITEQTQLQAGDSLVVVVLPIILDYVAVGRAGISQTFALSCEFGYWGPKYAVEEIRITAMQDFNQNYRAGDLLNDLFLIEHYNGQVYAYQPTWRGPLNQLEDKRNFISSKVWLKEAPDHSNPISFHVFVRDVKGNEYEAATSPITWN